MDTVGVALKADTRDFVKGFNDASQAVGNLGKAFGAAKGAVTGTIHAEMSRVKNTAIATGTALLATGLKVRGALKDFNALETNMRNVATVADLGKMSLGKLTDGVRQLAISGKVSQDVQQLSEGLYNIASSGFQGADAMKILGVAAQGASAGLTDTVVAGTAITQILNAYGMSAGAAAQVSDILFHTVNVGVLNFQELANTTGQWAANAAALKVPIGEATAALAAMTKAGSNADMAATSLRTIMLAFINPSEKMGTALAKIGVSSGQQLIAQKGLADGLKAVIAQTDGSAQSIQELFQDVQGLNGVLQLTGPQAQFFADQAKQMSSATGVAGETTKALAQQQQALGAQWMQFKNQLTELRLELGDLLQPIAKVVVGLGTNTLKAVNSLPGPLRQLMAGISLVSPAMAVLGAAWAIHAVKAALVAKAVNGIIVPMKNLAIVSKVPIIGKGLDAIADIAKKGVFRTLAGHIKDVILHSTNLTQAMGKLAIQGALTAGVIAATAVVIMSFVNGLKNADAEAKKFADTVGGIGLNGIKSLDQLNSKIAAVKTAAAQLGNSGSPGVLDSLWGGVQLANPFDDNTIINDQKKVEALNAKFAELGRTRALLTNLSGGMMDDPKTLAAVSSAVEKGTLDIDALMEAWKGITALFEQAPQMDWTKEQWDQFNLLNKVVSDARPIIADAGKEQEQLAQVAKSATKSEQDLAAAMLTLSDNTKTASEHAQAYGDVLDSLITKAMGQRNAQAQVGESLRGFIQAVSDIKEAGGSLDSTVFDPLSENGAKMQGVFQDISGSMTAWAQSIYDSTGDAGKANEALVGMAGGLIQVAQDAGFSGDQIQTLLTLIGLTPETVSSVVSVPGADEAMAQLFGVKGGLESIDGTTATAQVKVLVSTTIDPNAKTYANKAEFDAAAARGENVNNYDAAAAESNIKDIIQHVMDSVNAGVLKAGQGFKPKTSGGGGGGGSKTDQTITPQEAAAYAYEAGFRGADLVRIVAIMGRESGYNPKAYNPNSATGDLSYGLTQINMIGGLGAQRRAAMGLGSNDELFDPLTNAKAAFQIYQEQGNKLTAWGGYKGMSDTFNTDISAAQAAVDAFLQDKGKFGGGPGGSVADYIEQAIKQEFTGGPGLAASKKMGTRQTDRASVLDNITGGYSRTGQGIINEAIKTGQDPTDQFNSVADAYDELTKKVSKDTANQLLSWASNADEFKNMADEIIHQQELMQSKEDYQFSHGQMNSADYKKILQGRLAMTEEYSSEWISLMDQIDKVDQDASAATMARYARERKLMESKLAMNEIDRSAYKAYLADLLTHFEKYSDEYMDIWAKIHDLDQETKDKSKEVADSIKDAWKTAFDAIVDPIKEATSLVGAFGNSMDVTASQVTGFYEHMKEGTKRWVDAITQLQSAGLDSNLLQDLIHQGPQSLTLAQTLLGMGSEGIAGINSTLSDINNMATGFGQAMIPQANVGQVVDNSVHVTMGDFSLDIPDNLGLTREDVLQIVNSAMAAAAAAAQTGARRP